MTMFDDPFENGDEDDFSITRFHATEEDKRIKRNQAAVLGATFLTTAAVAGTPPAVYGLIAGTISVTSVAGVSALALPVTSAGVAVASAAFSGASFVKTHTHIKNLANLDAGDCNECQEALEYIIRQKRKKRFKKAVGTVPVAGILPATYTAIRSVTKKNKGVERSRHAHNIAVHLNNPNCLAADSIVAELFGEEMMGILINLSSEDAQLIIAGKMRSV